MLLVLLKPARCECTGFYHHGHCSHLVAAGEAVVRRRPALRHVHPHRSVGMILRLALICFGSFAVGFGLVVVIAGLLWANDLASKVLCYALLLISIE